jgi:hypothetical protein
MVLRAAPLAPMSTRVFRRNGFIRVTSSYSDSSALSNSTF